MFILYGWCKSIKKIDDFIVNYDFTNELYSVRALSSDGDDIIIYRSEVESYCKGYLQLLSNLLNVGVVSININSLSFYFNKYKNVDKAFRAYVDNNYYPLFK